MLVSQMDDLRFNAPCHFCPATFALQYMHHLSVSSCHCHATMGNTACGHAQNLIIACFVCHDLHGKVFEEALVCNASFASAMIAVVTDTALCRMLRRCTAAQTKKHWYGMQHIICVSNDCCRDGQSSMQDAQALHCCTKSRIKTLQHSRFPGDHSAEY